MRDNVSCKHTFEEPICVAFLRGIWLEEAENILSDIFYNFGRKLRLSHVWNVLSFYQFIVLQNQFINELTLGIYQKQKCSGDWLNCQFSNQQVTAFPNKTVCWCWCYTLMLLCVPYNKYSVSDTWITFWCLFFIFFLQKCKLFFI